MRVRIFREAETRAAIDRYIAEHGVTRCPAGFAAPSSALLSIDEREWHRVQSQVAEARAAQRARAFGRNYRNVIEPAAGASANG